MRRLAILLCVVALPACTATRAVRPSPSPSVSATPSPAPPAPVRFAVLGDWGAATSAQRAIADRMCSVRRTTSFDVVVTTGDNFYNPDGTATQKNYSSPETCVRKFAHWRAVWGNHDLRGTSTATELGATKHWYSWSLGAVAFFMLDSNDPSNPSQRAWLESSLGASHSAVKIAVFHHPGYTGGFHTNNLGVQRSWVPLFRRYHVTLVLNGHNHAYEHSRVDGVDYVVSGGGGASTYPCVSSPTYLIVCRPVHHFLIVEVLGRSVSVKAIAPDGGILDRFTIAA